MERLSPRARRMLDSYRREHAVGADVQRRVLERVASQTDRSARNDCAEAPTSPARSGLPPVWRRILGAASMVGAVVMGGVLLQHGARPAQAPGGHRNAPAPSTAASTAQYDAPAPRPLVTPPAQQSAEVDAAANVRRPAPALRAARSRSNATRHGVARLAQDEAREERANVDDLGARSIPPTDSNLRTRDVANPGGDGVQLPEPEPHPRAAVDRAASSSPEAARTAPAQAPGDPASPHALTMSGSEDARKNHASFGSPSSRESRSSDAEGSLDREVAQLRLARDLLLLREPVRALAALSEHERRFVGGALSEMREVARLDAYCQLGRTEEARAAATRFLDRYPQSAFGSRVKRICAQP